MLTKILTYPTTTILENSYFHINNRSVLCEGVAPRINTNAAVPLCSLAHFMAFEIIHLV